jgi:nickel/cobalt exporter
MDAISLTYLPIAIGLSALHALEPGHAKTMTAAYLVGIHGRWTDATGHGHHRDG